MIAVGNENDCGSDWVIAVGNESDSVGVIGL